MLGTRLRCGSSRASSVARVSMRNRGAFGKEIIALHCIVPHYADCGATAWPSVSPRRGRAIDAFAPTMRADRRYQPDRSLAPNTRSLRLMKRHARTLPLFITMVAMLAFAAPGYGALAAPVGSNTTVGVPDPAFSWTPVSGADHYVFELDSGINLGTPLVSISTKNTEATLTTTIPDGPYTWRVGAVDASSNNPSWSAAVHWTKTGTGPSLISPTDGGTV